MKRWTEVGEENATQRGINRLAKSAKAACGRAGWGLSIAIAVALVILLDGPVTAAPLATADCRPDARQASGAIMRFCLPPPGRPWNGDLFIYARGYVSPFEPLAIPEDQLTLGDVSLPDLLTSLGYAFATTSYAKTGLAIVEGVEDVAVLVVVFAREIGTPRHVFLAGPSEGGAVTALAIERKPERFDGGLAACAPVGSFRAQVNAFGDFRVLFDYFFPGLLPGTAVEIPPELVERWETTYVPLISAAVANNPNAADELIRVARAPIDEGDSSSVLATILDLFWYNAFSTADAASELGGQPFDNRRRWYHGSSDDRALNAGVQRFAADPTALATIAAHYETTGEVDRPLVTLHTTRDPVIRYWHEPLYRAKIKTAGKAMNHVNVPIRRYGHCAFTAAEALAAFAILVHRVTGADTSHLRSALADSE